MIRLAHRGSEVESWSEDGEQMSEVIDKCVVPWCNAPINGPQDFRNSLSLREFHISGMCQKCQDEVFEGEDENERGRTSLR